MNNNVVEKTLKSIDNIDRLSDLAAISIYNTSHEAIDKFDVMQEHATPEYVEGEFVQESLLTGVLIGAGIIGVAISAFLIIKKIIESKAKGDPNAAPNTVAGVNLLNPDEINKLFDGWNDKYFKNHPDLVAEDVPGADVGELNTYNGMLSGSIRAFCDNATKMIDGLNELSDANMKAAIDDLNKEFDSNINMDELVSKTGRVDKNTILQIKAAAEDISKTLGEFDMQVTKCIEGFRNKEKDNQNSGSDNEENKISEENIKLLEKALKAKANTAGTIMVNFRNKCLEGIAQALDAKVKEAEGQAKAKQQQHQQDNTGLTPEQKQLILKKVQARVPEADEHNISDEIARFGVAKSEQELRSLLDAEFEAMESNPNDGSKESFERMATVASEIAQIKGFNWNESVSTLYNLNALVPGEDTENPSTPKTDETSDTHEKTPEISSDNPEDKIKEKVSNAVAAGIDETAANLVARGDASGIASALGKFNISKPEAREQYIALYDNLNKALDFFNLASLKNIPENGIDKFMTPDEVKNKYGDTSSEDEIKNKFDDTQVTPEKIEKVVSAIEALDPDITLTNHDRKYIDWFLSANNKDSGISDIIDILEKRYKELLNSNESGKLSTFNKYLLMATTSADINGLNAEEINAAFPQNRLDLLATKSEDMETPSTEEPSSSKTSEETPENQTGKDKIKEIVQRAADNYGLNRGNFVDNMTAALIENNNDVNALIKKVQVGKKVKDNFNKFIDAVAKELGQDVTDETSGEQPKEAADKADNSEPAKDKNAERSDKVNITPEMEEKMKEVLLSAGEISQYGVIDENVVNHEIRQIKDMGLFKWTSGQYGDPNNVMSEQQDRCVKINNARYDAACNLAEIMGIDPDLVPKPTPLEQAATPTETPEGTPEAEPAKTEAPVNETENKDETSSSENANQNIDIQYDGNWVVINGKPVAYSDEEDDNIERKWPDEDNETANKLITGLINRGESPLNAIEDINDLWEYGSRDGNIINFLNGIYSSRNSLDNPNDLKIRTECYNKCKIMAEILGEPPVDELPKPDSVEKPSDDIKKISDSTGLDEGKVENIYKILKNNSTPDDVKRALIIDTIRPIMHMSGFNEDMTNKSFATNYANFKKVAEAANMPFEIELPKISEKDINDMHTIVDGAGTDETKLAKIADNLMNSTSTEKKDEGVEGDKEQELLSRITNGPTFAAEVAKAVDAGIPEDYARTTLSSLTMSDGKYSLIKERLKDYDWLNDFKQREAYKTAYNHYNDALLYFTDKGIRDIPELKDELPDPTVEFPNALNDENVMQRVLAQYPVNPETLRKDLEYFNTHIPDENLRYIIKDIIPKYFLENAFTKSFEETVNQIRNDDINVLKLAMINANIAEFKPSPEILKQVTDYINANLEKLKSRMTCTILADALVYGTFDPGMIDSETDSGSPKSTAEPKAQPSSPSNSSAGSRSGSKQQPVRKPVNKPGSGSKQQPTKKPKQGLFGKFFGI